MSNPLAKIIRDEMAATGPMTIARYMDFALQHPAHGYYRVHDPIGADGDFVTSPEISQMFGELIGLWCLDVWTKMGSPKEIVLLELGPGRGTLMLDMLRATAKVEAFHKALRIHLLESNEVLRAKQREKLAGHTLTYLENLADLPALPVLCVANEFFDALPIRQFVKGEADWRERLVMWDENRFSFVLSKPDRAFRMFVPEELRDAASGTEYELSPLSLVLMKQLAAHIAQHGGGGLVVDYGYLHPPEHGTFQGMSRRHGNDVLTSPGKIDLTAYVDFGALKRVASREGLFVAGPLWQSEFLKALGIDFRAAQLKHTATPEQAASIDVDLHRLTADDQMGSLFKVMGLLSPNLKDVAGLP